ncbi:hypothetical protein D3C84_883940 [compost metagenome]
MTGYFAVDANGHFSHQVIELFGVLQYTCGGLVITHQFNEWNEVWWIERVAQNEVGRVFPSCLHFAERQARCGGCDDGASLEHRLDFRVQSMLDLDALRGAFLNEVG